MMATDAVGFKQKYRTFIQGKTRIALAWIFSIALVLSARHYPWWPGVALCFVGATLRFWASGYLHKDSMLACGGPYRFTRNPLYFGTYLMAIGTALATKNFWLFAAITVLFAAIYHYIILDEEIKLKRLFGPGYDEFATRVARFFPQPWPGRVENTAVSRPIFSFALAWRNKAYEAYAAFAALIGFVWIVAWMWENWF